METLVRIPSFLLPPSPSLFVFPTSFPVCFPTSLSYFLKHCPLSHAWIMIVMYKYGTEILESVFAVPNTNFTKL